jgi:hypothetical protein
VNRFWFELVQTGLATAKNRKRPVYTGPVRFFAGFGIARTGLGLGLRRLRQKTETGPDFQTLNKISKIPTGREQQTAFTE